MNYHVPPQGSATANTGRASDLYRFPVAPLAADHYQAYEAARTHLKALATATPATSPIDYWEILQHVDALHDPFARMAAQSAPEADRSQSYGAARAAIVRLANCGFDPHQIAPIVTNLDACWQSDPHRGRPRRDAGGTR